MASSWAPTLERRFSILSLGSKLISPSVTITDDDASPSAACGVVDAGSRQQGSRCDGVQVASRQQV